MALLVQLKWNGKDIDVDLEGDQTVGDLKRVLHAETRVSEKRIKLIGMKRKDGKPVDEETTAGDILIKKGVRLMMMGTPDEEIDIVHAAAAAAEISGTVADDLNLDMETGEAVPVREQPEVMEKLKRRIQSVEIKVLNPPREGKKCLVLDIDYTLFDLGGTAERPEELARPFLHEFLSSAYQHYDIVIWSATGKKWVEVKMRELGVLSHPEYKVTCMLDHSAMVTVSMERYGVFDCKPLAFLWAKFTEYNEANTIMMDDLGRNFVMNPQNGLKIRPYRKSNINRSTDRELLHLSHYLSKISALESLSQLDHRRWESYRG